MHFSSSVIAGAPATNLEMLAGRFHLGFTRHVLHADQA
jgi:hypothetical protein